MAKKLMHGRLAMKPEPANMRLAQAAKLVLSGAAARVSLEPGDGTRYDLIVAESGGVLLAVRLGGSEPSAMYWAPYMHDAEERVTRTLGNKNAWSGKFLHWWLGVLWEALWGART